MKRHAIFLSTLLLTTSGFGCGAGAANEEDSATTETAVSVDGFETLNDLLFDAPEGNLFDYRSKAFRRHFRAKKGQHISVTLTSRPLRASIAVPWVCVWNARRQRCDAEAKKEGPSGTEARLEYDIPADADYEVRYREASLVPTDERGSHLVRLSDATPLPPPIPVEADLSFEPTSRVSLAKDANGGAYVAFIARDQLFQSNVRFGRFDPVRNAWNLSTIFTDKTRGGFDGIKMTVDKRGDIHALVQPSSYGSGHATNYLRSLDGGKTFASSTIEPRWGPQTSACDLAEGGGFTTIVGVCGSLRSTYLFWRGARQDGAFTFRALETMPHELNGPGVRVLGTTQDGYGMFMSTAGVFAKESALWEPKLTYYDNINLTGVAQGSFGGNAMSADALLFRTARYPENGWVFARWSSDGSRSISPLRGKNWDDVPSSATAATVREPDGSMQYVFDGERLINRSFGRDKDINFTRWPTLSQPSAIRVAAGILVVGVDKNGKLQSGVIPR